jgi:chaperonin GroEL (HSP60 family)
MIVDDIGDVTISNDGATILKLLEVEHPAARVLVELAEQQDKEVGDGTTSVVIIAAELLRRYVNINSPALFMKLANRSFESVGCLAWFLFLRRLA